MAKLRLSITIYGKVQGVGFRYFASRKAKYDELTGFITNQSDGSVYAEIEGEREAVYSFLNFCHHGPKTARVTKVSSKEIPPNNDRTFLIKK